MAEKKNRQSDTLRDKKKMLAELRDNLGIVTTSAYKVGIHRDTHYEWMKRDKRYRKKVEEIMELQKGEVEDGLLKAIRKGSIPAIMFYLKNKHKQYRPRQTISFEHEKIDKDLDKITKVLDGK